MTDTSSAVAVDYKVQGAHIEHESISFTSPREGSQLLTSTGPQLTSSIVVHTGAPAVADSTYQPLASISASSLVNLSTFNQYLQQQSQSDITDYSFIHHLQSTQVLHFNNAQTFRKLYLSETLDPTVLEFFHICTEYLFCTNIETRGS